jgi:hypothetical protein
MNRTTDLPVRDHSKAVDLDGTMDLRYLLTHYQDGDGLGWPAEFAWLRTYRYRGVADITASFPRDGFREPISLGDDGRVWDGHHRLAVADALNLRRVPVEFAVTDYDETTA